MSFSKFYVILGLVGIGVLSRLLPHPPNCTALNAVALLSAYHFKNCGLAFAALCATLFLSDSLIGYHSMMPFVYFSFGLIILMGFKLKSSSLTRVSWVSVSSSLVFFFITNFGEWFAGSLYSKTVEGLNLCFLAALPFLGYQVFGDLCYTLLLFTLLNAFERYTASAQPQKQIS